ncbi:hypothetical protein QQF64_021521, partial [Cirrhinus molitorella]
LSQDELMCPVCLDLLKDPVSIQCGHSYCKSCITGCWDQEDQMRVYSCPQCRQTFSPRPALSRNIMLAELVEKLKKRKRPADCDAGAGDVQCDVCTGRKYKAVKSCLMCLNSYCQNHLEQHESLFKRKRHNLTTATGRLQEMICQKHEKHLEMYCITDQQCICVLCTEYEHQNHDTVSAAARRTEKQTQLKETQKTFQQRIQQKEKDVQQLRETVESHKRSAQTAVEDSKRIFTELIRSIKRRCSELIRLIRDQEKAAVSRTEGRLERLEQEINDLRRREAELEQLSHTQDHIQFLQIFQSLPAPPESTDVNDNPFISLFSFDDLRESVHQLRDKLEDSCKEELKKISDRVTSTNIVPRTRNDFLQYSHQLTLDLSTVNKSLRLSESNKVITYTDTDQSKMAEPRFSQDELMCPVCLDLLKDPVSIQCGHSYCKSCITDCWDQEDQMRVYSCPQCRQTFSPRPALATNTMLAELVEKLKKTEPSADCYAGAGDVQCDLCTGRKYKAVKSCLMCQESYCQTHFDHHKELHSRKPHKVIDATERLQEMICQKHKKLLKVFCRTDQKCICMLCTMDDHRNHNTVSAAAQRTEEQKQLKEMQKTFQQRIQQKEKDVQQLREAVESHKRSAQTAVEDSERIFTELIRSIERSRSELIRLIRDQEKAAVSRAEGRLERLEQEINDLRRREAELEQLSHTQDHIQFLQSFQSLLAPPASTDVNDDPFISLFSADDLRESVYQRSNELKDFCKEELKKISDRVTSTNIVPRTSNDLLQYSHQLTLDLNTKLLKEMQKTFQERIQQKEKDVQQLREAVKSHKRSAQTAVEDSKRIFTELIRSIERSRSEMIWLIRDQEKAAVSRAEGRLERLEQEINDLMRRNAKLEQLSHIQDHIQFLQSFQSLSAPPASTDVKDSFFISLFSYNVLRESVHQLRDKLEDFCKDELKKISGRVTFTNIVPRTRNDFLQYSHQLTLDLNTKQLKETQKTFQQRIQQREKDVQQLREAVESHKRSAQTAVEDSERIFTELIRSIERSRSELIRLIRDQEKAAVSRAEGRLERLELEINDLTRRDAELEQLSHIQDNIQFLQSFQSLSALPEYTEGNDDPFSSLFSFDDLRESVHQLRDKLEDFCKDELKKISDRVTFTNIVLWTRNDFLQYSHQFTLDLNTANEFLCLSENNRVITNTDTVQPYPDNPDRFDEKWQVLCRESVCGRCYWELEWSGGVRVSVSYKSITKKGSGDECLLGFNDQSWSLFCSPSSYSFIHDNLQTALLVKPISSRIGVYVDHSAGTLSFYNVSDTMSLIHTEHTTFTQPLYPAFWVGSGSSVKLLLNQNRL